LAYKIGVNNSPHPNPLPKGEGEIRKIHILITHPRFAVLPLKMEDFMELFNNPSAFQAPSLRSKGRKNRLLYKAGVTQSFF
jgi:hypothetical protein